MGLVRDNNEDAYALAENVWAVADGLGGHAGGEIASSLAIDAAMRAMAESADLGGAFSAAHAAIARAAAADPALADMGTTLVLAHRDAQGRIRIGNVGDSRAYLLAGGALSRLTVDDNHAQELFDRGELSEAEARVHPGRFWLSKALGLGDRVAPQPKLSEVTASSGRLLLCTDGLNSELPDERTAEIVSEGLPQQAADALVEAALGAGGGDNVTVVVVDF